MEPNGKTGSITITARGHSPFTSSDVGRLIRLEYPGYEAGVAVITGFTSSSVVTAQVRREIPYASVPTEAWRMGAWSDVTGYPKGGSFYEGRSVVGYSAESPSTVVFSQSGDIENMQIDSFLEGVSTVEDDDAMRYTLNSTSQGEIQWVLGASTLLIGTAGGIWSMTSDGSVITTTDRRAAEQDTTTVAEIPPLSIGSAVVFAGGSKRRLFDLGYQYETNSYVPADLTVLSDHVFKAAPMSAYAFKQYPYPAIIALRDHADYNDGRIYELAYNRREDIVGWSRMILGGSMTGSAFGEPVVESIAIIPGADDSGQDYNFGDRSEVWLSVKRTIDGSTVRYIEFFEGAYEAPDREDYASDIDWIDAVQSGQKDAFFVDCGITYSGSSTDTIIGLDHLEGETVTAFANGKIVSGLTVSGGEITLTDSASTVQVGLPYETYYESLKLPYGGQSGPTIMTDKAVHHIGVDLIGSGPFEIGIATYDYSQDDPPRVERQTEEFNCFMQGTSSYMMTLYSGERVFSVDSGISKDPRIVIKTSNPVPLIISGIGPTIEPHEIRSGN